MNDELTQLRRDLQREAELLLRADRPENSLNPLPRLTSGATFQQRFFRQIRVAARWLAPTDIRSRADGGRMEVAARAI